MQTWPSEDFYWNYFIGNIINGHWQSTYSDVDLIIFPVDSIWKPYFVMSLKPRCLPKYDIPYMSLSCANLRYSIMASSRGIAPFSSCFFVTASSILFLDFPFWRRIDSGMKFSSLTKDYKLMLVGSPFYPIKFENRKSKITIDL